MNKKKCFIFILTVGFILFSWLVFSCASIPNEVSKKTDDGFIYTVDGLDSNWEKPSVRITGYTGKSKDIVIPALIEEIPVKKIQHGAFQNKHITSVVFPDSVLRIEDYAFAYNDISRVAFPPRIEVIYLTAFYNNPLASVVLPQGKQKDFLFENGLLLVTPATIHASMYKKFVPSSPAKGVFILVCDDRKQTKWEFNHITAVNSYATSLLRPARNIDLASLIIYETYSYSYVGTYSAGPFPGFQSNNPYDKTEVYKKQTNVRVEDAVTGKVLFNKDYKSSAPESFFIDNQYGIVPRVKVFDDFDPGKVKLEIEAIVEVL